MKVTYLNKKDIPLIMFVEIRSLQEELPKEIRDRIFTYSLFYTSQPKSHMYISLAEGEQDCLLLGYVDYIVEIGGLRCSRFYPYQFARPRSCGKAASDLIQLLVAEDIVKRFSGDIRHQTKEPKRIAQLARLHLETDVWYPAEEYIERIKQGIKESIYK